MSVITQIKPQKNKKRVNIYLDQRFAFGLDLENYLKINLKVGDELSDKEVKEIVEKSEFSKTFDKLLRFATLRPRSQREVNDWFYRKKVHESMQDKLIKKLEKLGFLDDEEFAKWWVGQRVSFKPRGKGLLRVELRQKGVEKDVIENILAELDEEIDEKAMAKKLLKKNGYKWERLESREKKMKASRYLASKGFGWDVIKTVMEELWFDE
jgi:regulatory protein